jgi:hypothetical protein
MVHQWDYVIGCCLKPMLDTRGHYLHNRTGRPLTCVCTVDALQQQEGSRSPPQKVNCAALRGLSTGVRPPCCPLLYRQGQLPLPLPATAIQTPARPTSWNRQDTLDVLLSAFVLCELCCHSRILLMS